MYLAHTGGNSKEFGGPIYLGKFTYNTCTSERTPSAYCESPTFLNNIANVANYQQSYGNAIYTVNDALWALFVQDDYRVTNRLTLNAGLRYERQTFTDAHVNFAPRVGFVYDVTGNGQDCSARRLRHLLLADRRQRRGQLCADRAHGRLQLHRRRRARSAFPPALPPRRCRLFPPAVWCRCGACTFVQATARIYNQFFPTSTLVGYPSKLLNPYSEQYTLSLEQQLRAGLGAEHRLRRDAHAAHHSSAGCRCPSHRSSAPRRTRRRTAQAANCTRPYWIDWYAAERDDLQYQRRRRNPQPPYSVIQTDVNDGFLHYNALDVNLHHSLQPQASPCWPAIRGRTRLDNVDPDTTSQNPNDPNFTGQQEYGNAHLRSAQPLRAERLLHRPFKIHIGGVATLASGLPYNLITGATNSGDTGAHHRPARDQRRSCWPQYWPRHADL